MAMGPRYHRIAQPIGMLERDPEDCSNTSDSCSGYKRYCYDAQQATTFVCRSSGVTLCGAHVRYDISQVCFLPDSRLLSADRRGSGHLPAGFGIIPMPFTKGCIVHPRWQPRGKAVEIGLDCCPSWSRADIAR
jgi:hypothetical protein